MKAKTPTFNLRDQVIKKIGNTKRSWQWYETNVRNAAGKMSGQKFLGDNIAHQSTKIVPGTLVSFFYDPKTKDTLPYYDTFPMILPFATDDTGFMGLNMHYLHPIMRAALLDKLMEYASNDKLSSKTKIKVTWEVLKAASNMPEIKHCIKRYLNKQVKSNFIIIPPTEWNFVLWLPLEYFKKASNEKVWEDGRV
jgi:hypothetical protein